MTPKKIASKGKAHAKPKKEEPFIPNRFNLTRDPEFENLILSRTKEEIAQHRKSLEKHGCIDPIVAWKDYKIIVDGHNRYNICEELKIPYKIHEIAFTDRTDVINHIIENQLGRRNLTNSQKAYFRGKRYNNEVNPPGRPKGGHSDHKKTDEKIAEQMGFSPRTIRRDADYAKHIDLIIEEIGPEFGKMLIGEDIKLTRSDVKELSESADKKALAELIGKGQKTSLSRAKRELESREAAKNEKLQLEFADANSELAQWVWNPIEGCSEECLAAPKNTEVPEDAEFRERMVQVCPEGGLLNEEASAEWIARVVKVISECPKFTFLLNAEFPKTLKGVKWPRNAWIGTTIDSQERVENDIKVLKEVKAAVKFMRIDLQDEPIKLPEMPFQWLILGVKGNGPKAPKPTWDLVEPLLAMAREKTVKVYFTKSLKVRPMQVPDTQKGPAEAPSVASPIRTSTEDPARQATPPESAKALA